MVGQKKMASEKQKIAIIGAGFTGLSAALELISKGCLVTIFEKEASPGGLAIGFKEKDWDWPLEKHYHHIFTSDKEIINLASEVGVKIIFKRPKTTIYLKGGSWQLDSPISLLTFPHLSILNRLRTGVVLAYLRILPFWKILEGETAVEFLKKSMGENAWKTLWEPLFKGKFGSFFDQIPASWFWSRIKKRSASLGYPDGGFETLALKVAQRVQNLKGKFLYQTGVVSIEKKGDQFSITTDTNKSITFDQVISTLPTPLFIQTVKGLPRDYIESLTPLKGLGAVNLVLILKEQFLKDQTYWLNVNDLTVPFLAVVEHTNFIDHKNYDGKRLVYVGNYLPPDHHYFDKTERDLIKEFSPYLKKINHEFNEGWIEKAYLFKAKFAQPIIPLNYSKILPKLKTPFKGLYLANIQQVYPWDRGTNYAVELGKRVAKLVLKIRHD